MTKKTKKYLSQTGFSKLVGTSRQAVSLAVKKKTIHKDKNGIDPNHKTNKKYIRDAKEKAGNQLRSIAAQKTNQKALIKRSDSDKEDTVKVKVDGVTIDVPASELEEESDDEIGDIAKRYLIARTSKIEQEDLKLKLGNARLRGEMLDSDEVYDSVFLFLDQVLSNLERLSGTFLQDVSYKIINSEELTQEVRQSWIDQTLKQIDQAKHTIVKKLETIAREQK